MNTVPNPQVLAIARTQVKDLLTAMPGFHDLSADQRRDLAHNMVKIATYIAAGERGDSTPNAAHFESALAAPKAGPKTTPQQNAPLARVADPDVQSVRDNVETFTDEIKKVDFPKFVADLVNGVFNAIVDSSIKQMNAYAELVKNVAKSVDQYMKDNVTENQARDYLVDKYPNHLELNMEGKAPTVRPKEGADDATMPNFFSDLGLPSPGASGVDEETVEQQLVPAARKRLAMDRQQLLATMVLMGVNRLVVTDGSLKASVIFDFKAKISKKNKRSSTTTANLNSSTNSSTSSSGWGWFSGYNSSDNTTEFTVESVDQSSSSQENSAELKTKLTGEVNLRFKSETFPLEKMGDLIQPELRDKMQGKAPPKPAAPVAGPPPPPPQLPPIGAPSR